MVRSNNICDLPAVGVFAYVQESKNNKIMESFKKMVPSIAMVIRDGQRREILAEEIVVGDLVEIQMGDKIPADIRVTECTGLRVENSSITGNCPFFHSFKRSKLKLRSLLKV